MDSEPDPKMVHEIPEDRIDDPREHEEWFCRLPVHGREELRRRWRIAEGIGAEYRDTRARTTRRYVLEGAALFAVFDLLVAFFTSFHAGRFLIAAIVGAGFGWVSRRLYVGRFGYGALGAFLYCLIYQWLVLLLPFHFVMFIGIATLLGAGHELQRADRSEI